jgi:hypothetical protein
MGEFDNRIIFYKEQLRLAREDLAYYADGNRWLRDDIDITEELIERAKRTAEQTENLIAEYESSNLNHE